MLNSKFHKPFLIAEISANHGGSIQRARKLIKCAKIYGADAVKLQTYSADSMTIKSNKNYFKIKNGLWKNYVLWDLYDKAQTPYKWHKDLFSYAKKIGIHIFSTPFDEHAVDFLETLNCPIYKVASCEMTDIPLIKKIAKTKKTMIISTGLANLKEIDLTFNTALKFGSKNVILLYCVSNYPSKTTDFHLNNIKILKNKFACTVGLSDHSKDPRVAIAAVASGAEVVEKHIALNNQKIGLDLKFSLKGKEIRQLRNDIDATYNFFKNKNFYRSKEELKGKVFRRSIFVVKNIKRGQIFDKTNIRRIRPGQGLEPKYYEKILGKKSPINLYRGNPLKKNILKFLKIKQFV